MTVENAVVDPHCLPRMMALLLSALTLIQFLLFIKMNPQVEKGILANTVQSPKSVVGWCPANSKVQHCHLK